MTKTTDAQLMKLVEPAFLSIVKSPANRTGFKIIRSAKGTTTVKEETAKRKFRKRLKAETRSDESLLSIDLPAGTTEDEAIAMMDAFGMTADYELLRDAEDKLFLKRKDIGGGSNNVEPATVPIDLGAGYVANVTEDAFASRSETDKTITGVTLIGIEFDGFEKEAALEWLAEREINFKTDGLEVFDGGVVVTRHDVPEGNEVRKVRIAPCVTGLVARTKETDVPAKVYRSVIEQSYGQWGWGHLNYASSLADVEFTDRSWDAIDTLRSVMENVILYSGLPLDERKTLVQNASEQFTSYIVSLIDSLPREVIEQARAESKQQENIEMADSKGKQASEKAPEDKAAASTDVDDRTEETTARSEEEAETKTEVEAPLSRDEVVALVAEAVTVAIRELTPEKEEQKAERSEEDSTDTVEKDDAVLKAIEAMRSDFTALKGEVEEMAGTTITRSDMDDESEDEQAVKRDENGSPFGGMFGDRFRSIN